MLLSAGRYITTGQNWNFAANTYPNSRTPGDFIRKRHDWDCFYPVLEDIGLRVVIINDGCTRTAYTAY